MINQSINRIEVFDLAVYIHFINSAAQALNNPLFHTLYKLQERNVFKQLPTEQAKLTHIGPLDKTPIRPTGQPHAIPWDVLNEYI